MKTKRSTTLALLILALPIMGKVRFCNNTLRISARTARRANSVMARIKPELIHSASARLSQQKVVTLGLNNASWSDDVVKAMEPSIKKLESGLLKNAHRPIETPSGGLTQSISKEGVENLDMFFELLIDDEE